MNRVTGRSRTASDGAAAYVSLNASSAYSNARSMYSSPRIRNHSLRRRPSGCSAPSETTSLTTSNATSGFVAEPKSP